MFNVFISERKAPLSPRTTKVVPSSPQTPQKPVSPSDSLILSNNDLYAQPITEDEPVFKRHWIFNVTDSIKNDGMFYEFNSNCDPLKNYIQLKKDSPRYYFNVDNERPYIHYEHSSDIEVNIVYSDEHLERRLDQVGYRRSLPMPITMINSIFYREVDLTSTKFSDIIHWNSHQVAKFLSINTFGKFYDSIVAYVSISDNV